MSEPSAKDGVLFKTYATVVAQHFSPDTNSEDSLSLFPGYLPDKKKDTHLSHWMNPTDYKTYRHSVDRLRQVLESERNAVGSGPMYAHLREFNKALESGDEFLLEANPFYDLTKLLFRLHLNASLGLFEHLQNELVANPPEKRTVSRTLWDIWIQSDQERVGLERWIETVEKWFVSAKVFLTLFLFVIIGATTARAVNGLLQTPEFFWIADGMMQGREGEFPRYLLSLFVGGTLSAVVLDWKRVLFQSIVHSEGVFQGIRSAFLRYPRWMMVASVLTLVAIKCNFDSLVPLFLNQNSQIGDVSQVRKGIDVILGNAETINDLEPVSLYDFQAVLVQAENSVISKLSQLPKDELAGRGSSKDPRKGPRYWGKYFIVEGGFEAGKRDVVHLFRDIGFSRRMDQLLSRSGIDFYSPFSEKVRLLVSRYQSHLSLTDDLIQQHVHRLDSLTLSKDRSLNSIIQLLTLERYQVDLIMVDILDVLIESQAVFNEVSEDFYDLLDAHIKVLAQVDHYGASEFEVFRSYAKIPLPNSQAVSQLKELIQTRSSAPIVLTEGLEGGSFGLMVLGMLFLSVMMVLADLIFYARWTVQRGKRDKPLMGPLMRYLMQWESAFLQQCAGFFQRLDVRQILMGFSCPNQVGIRNGFYRHLEEVSVQVKHPSERGVITLFFGWLSESFVLMNRVDITGYNHRVVAIERFINNRSLHFRRLLENLLPGVRFYRGMASGETFHGLLLKYQTRHSNVQKEFFLESQNLMQTPTQESADASGIEKKMALEEQKRLLQVIEKLGYQSEQSDLLKRLKTDKPVIKPVSRSYFSGPRIHRMKHFFFLIFQLSFLPPIPDFVHTRRHWLQNSALQEMRSLEHRELLQRYVPNLKEILFSKLPDLKSNVLLPLSEIQSRFPSAFANSDMMPLEHFTKPLDALGMESLDLWKFTQIEGTDKQCVFSKDSDDESSLETAKKPGIFSNRVDELTKDVSQALKRAKKLESELIHEMDACIVGIREACKKTMDASQEIEVRVFELQRMRPPPRELLGVLSDNQEVIKRIPVELVATQENLKSILKKEPLYNEHGFRLLKALLSEVLGHQERMNTILGALGAVPHIDRRAESVFKDASLFQEQKNRVQDNSRRLRERQKYAIPIVLEYGQGTVLEGVTKDISLSGIGFEANRLPKDLKADMSGTFRLLNMGSNKPFPCRIVAVDGPEVKLHLISGQPRFEMLIKDAIFEELNLSEFGLPKRSSIQEITPSLYLKGTQPISAPISNQDIDLKDKKTSQYDSLKQSKRTILGVCEKIRRTLLGINMRKFELRKVSPFPLGVLLVLKENQSLLVSIPKDSETILRNMETVLGSDASLEEKLRLLNALQVESQSLWDSVQSIDAAILDAIP